MEMRKNWLSPWLLNWPSRVPPQPEGACDQSGQQGPLWGSSCGTLPPYSRRASGAATVSHGDGYDSRAGEQRAGNQALRN